MSCSRLSSDVLVPNLRLRAEQVGYYTAALPAHLTPETFVETKNVQRRVSETVDAIDVSQKDVCRSGSASCPCDYTLRVDDLLFCQGPSGTNTDERIDMIAKMIVTLDLADEYIRFLQTAV